MYLRYFGLNEAPFSITPDPAFVFLSPRHRDALAHLMYGVGKGGSGGFVQLTGEVGTGKTTLCRCLLEQVPEGTHIALLLNPLVTPRELLAAISEELGIDVSGSIDSTRLLVDGLNRYLLSAHGRGESVVVVIDEAQNLKKKVLEEIRMLSGIETHKEKVLRIILAGHPELKETLESSSLEQLAQRIRFRYHIGPLNEPEMREYIEHRLNVAGIEANDLIVDDAFAPIYRYTGGIPRLINTLCDTALLCAFADDKQTVDAEDVMSVVKELNWKNYGAYVRRVA